MTFAQLCRQLSPTFDEGEARAILRLLLSERFGLSLADALCGGIDRLPAASQDALAAAMERLRTGEPVQYVVGHETFLGRRFKVTPAVLIPRPETEELCRWVIETPPRPSSLIPHPSSLLDIGTGSGCIAISLALALPQAEVAAWDISDEALAVARENARNAQARVSFHRQDALNPPDDTARWDTIVSNPPYVCDSERAEMATHVVDHEPAQALFVPDDDPLRFYRAIARYARKALRPDGRLYFELNPRYAEQLSLLLGDLSFSNIVLRCDQFGRKRFLRATQGQTP